MASPAAPLPDVQSRSVVREFLMQAGIGVGLISVLYIVKAQTTLELAHAAVRVFSFYSIVDCVRALIKRETLWSASLNRWDQAAAYMACATVCRLFLDLQSPA